MGWPSIHDMSSIEYASHLRGIRSHWQRLQTKRKAEAKARQAEYKVPAKAYSIRRNDKGTLVLTIRKRKPAYLYVSEWNELVAEWPRDELQALLAKRNITIKKDPT